MTGARTHADRPPQLADVRPALDRFVRGLLGREVPLHAAPPGTTRTFASEHGWFFPARFPMYAGEPGRALYFAAAAHLAAHARFGAPRMAPGTLRPIQRVLTAVLEDARVEQRLACELPGLRPLWAGFHRARAADHPTFPALCARIARALIDPRYDDPHPLVARARSLADEGRLASVAACRELASLLGHEIGQLRLPFNAKEYVVEPPYRDDHRLLWDVEPPPPDAPTHSLAHMEPERARAARGEARDDVRANREGRADAEPASARPSGTERDATFVARFPYREYDYRIGTSRPDFCTVCEAARGPHDLGDGAAARVAGLDALAPLARRLRATALTRRRREHDGDALDLDAALAVRLDLAQGHAPDPRVFVRSTRVREPLALLVLLDLSASTGDPVRGTEGTVLALARDACLSLGELLARTGDRFAVHGFSSEGRAQVGYERLKELDEPWDAAARARIAEVAPRFSTRMGPALRHAARALAHAHERHKLLLIVTDGEPSDIDAPDPRYLLHDARDAVQEARRRGVQVFALSLDARADRYVRRIFGAGRYLVLEHLARLPEVLTALYARLAR